MNDLAIRLKCRGIYYLLSQWEWKCKLLSCDPMDPVDCVACEAPLSTEFSRQEHEWVAIPFSRGSSLPRNQTEVSCIAGRFFTSWATREAHVYEYTYTDIYFFGLFLSTYIHEKQYLVNAKQKHLLSWLWLHRKYGHRDIGPQVP